MVILAWIRHSERPSKPDAAPAANSSSKSFPLDSIQLDSNRTIETYPLDSEPFQLEERSRALNKIREQYEQAMKTRPLQPIPDDRMNGAPIAAKSAADVPEHIERGMQMSAQEHNERWLQLREPTFKPAEGAVDDSIELKLPQ